MCVGVLNEWVELMREKIKMEESVEEATSEATSSRSAVERTKEELFAKRGLKRAKLFEIQKLTKKSRLLKNKRGSELQMQRNKRKSQRLIDEVELIKDINLNDLAFAVTCCDHEIELLLNLAQPPLDIAKRAKWRLLQSKGFNKSLIKITKDTTISTDSTINNNDTNTTSIDTNTARIDTSTASIDTNTTSIDTNAASINTSTAHTREQFANVNVLVEGSDSQNKGEMFDQDETSEDEDSIVTEGEEIESLICKDKKNLLKPRPAKLSKVPSKLKKSTSNASSKMSKASLASVFVGSLSRKKKVGNRLGQRARQKLWESKYGEQAVHVLKKRTEGARNSSVLKSGKKKWAKVVEQNSAEKPQESLHPSWEASRRRKAQSSIQPSQGQRIVFSDSD